MSGIIYFTFIKYFVMSSSYGRMRDAHIDGNTLLYEGNPDTKENHNTFVCSHNGGRFRMLQYNPC